MKKRGILVLAAAIAAFNMHAFAAETEEATDTGEKLKVMASFYPMYDFAEKIGGDYVEVTNMVPAGTEPHDWEPAATDIKNLEEADVFVYNGVGMEHWVEDVLASLENKDLKVVEASKGLELLAGGEEEEEDEATSDAQAEEDSEAAADDQTEADSEAAADDQTEADSETTADAQTETDSEAAEAISYDPHVWLSPKNAKQEMNNIKEALIEADPDHADAYEQNYETYAAKMDDLDAEYQEKLADTKSKDLIVAHEAFGYLCRDYGLNQVGIEGLSPDSEPDAKRMNEIIAFAKENNVKTIFFEELVSPKVAETIASEIGAKTEVLNPLEGLTDEEISAGEDYFSVMESNLEALTQALNE